MRFLGLLYLSLGLLSASAGRVQAEETVRNYGATYVEPTTPSTIVPQPLLIAESKTVVSGDSAAALVAFGHHRRRNCCGYGAYGAGFPAAYGPYGTYQPNVYASGYYGSNYAGSVYGNGYYGPPTPNPYGYYQNGQIWGSSRPTYTGPFPVWNSPSGIYDYRYKGWGSYGWGGWGGTGPAGWGYQGGFYW